MTEEGLTGLLIYGLYLKQLQMTMWQMLQGLKSCLLSHLAKSSELLWPSALQHPEVDDVSCSPRGGFSPEEPGHSGTRLRIEGEAKRQAGNLTPAQGRTHPCPPLGLLSGFTVRSECSPALLQKRIKK